MSASIVRTGTIVMAMGAALFGHVAVAEAQQPTSLLQWFNAIPNSPTTPEEADKLVDWNGESSSTGSGGGLAAMPALKAGLDAHEAAVHALIEAAHAKIDARIGVPTGEKAVQGMTKGAAAAGIDVARMQNDPAYAKEMQAKMKAMSPAELMALATAMQQGMGMKGTVAVYDPPAVKAAADAGRAYLDPEQQAQRTAAYERRWTEVAKKKAAIDATYSAKYPTRVMCDTDPSCGDRMTRYANAMMPLVYAHDTEVLKLEAAAFEEERAALAVEVGKADELLRAAQYGATSQEPGNPLNIMSLDGNIASQIRTLAIKLEDIVKRAGEVGHCRSKPLEFFYQRPSCFGVK